MRLLLDTHTFLWLVTDRSRLDPHAAATLTLLENEVYYSAATSWEIATKRAKGKLEFRGSPVDLARSKGLTVLPISGEHCEAAAALPAHHFDPFDRLLIAQAHLEGLLLATRDQVMGRYGVRILKV